MSRFFFGMICGAALLYTSMHYHVIRSDKGFHLVPKLSQNLSNVYVDIRDYSVADWQDRKIVAAAIVKADQSDLLGGTAVSDLRDSVGRMVEAFF